MSEARVTRPENAAVVAAWLVVGLLTLPHLASRSLSSDEIGSLWMAEHFEAALGDSNMLLYHALLRAWLVLGSGDVLVRGLSVVFALATIPVVFAIARRMFCGRTAAVAVSLLATNVFFLRYAQEARSYSLFVLLSSLSVLLALRATRQPTWRRWTACGLITAAGVYAHFFAVLILPVHALIVLVAGPTRRRVAGLLLSVAVAALCVCPVSLLTPLDAGQVSWIEVPSARELVGVPRRLAGNRALLVLASATTVWGGVSSKRWPWEPVVTCTAWLTVPILAAFAFSHAWKPLFSDRYLILCLPALVLLAAAGIARLPHVALQALAVAAFILGSVTSLDRAHVVSDDWRGVAAMLDAEMLDKDTVVLSSEHGAREIAYYARSSPARDRVVVGAPAAGTGRAWFVIPEAAQAISSRRVETESLADVLSAARTQSSIRRFDGVTVRTFDPESGDDPR